MTVDQRLHVTHVLHLSILQDAWNAQELMSLTKEQMSKALARQGRDPATADWNIEMLFDGKGALWGFKLTASID